MKAIHPKWYPDAKVIVNGETVMRVGATQPELHVEVWSGTHPFYTGKLTSFADTQGKIQKFQDQRKQAKKKLLSKKEKRELKTQKRIREELSKPSTLEELRKRMKEAKKS